MPFERGLGWQIRQQLESWKSLGVQFVPVAPPCPWSFAEPVAVVEAADPLAKQRVELQTLHQTVAQCTRCPSLSAIRSQTVSGLGAIQADLCVIGDVPSAEDDATGVPFQGAIAELLTKMTTAMGVAPERVYRTVAVRCKPPGIRPASVAECRNCREYLVRELELVQPKAIVCFGVTAIQVLQDHQKPMQEVRGSIHEYKSSPVICTYHPRIFTDQPNAKAACWEDMKLLMNRMGWARKG